MPTEVLDRHGAKAEDIFAGQTSDQLKAAAGRSCGGTPSRQLAVAPNADLEFAPATLLPALCCRCALVGPGAARPMDRRGYEPFDVQPAVAVAGNGCSGARRAIPAASSAPEVIRRRSACGTPLQASQIGQCALAHRRLLSQVLGRTAASFAAVLVEAAGSISGGNRPKLIFIGWNDDGPGSMASMWPPVMWPSRAPCAVVTGGGVIGFAPALGGGKAPPTSRWRRIRHSLRSR